MQLERAIMHVGRGLMDAHLSYVEEEQRVNTDWLHADARNSLLAIENMRHLIASPLNAHGELYQYWFNISDVNIYPGNNVLLLAISRACHSVSDEHTQLVARMVLEILNDAKQKLTPECFKHFIAFRYISAIRGNREDYFFDNTPLTLAINAGLHGVTSWILNTDLLTQEDINIQSGQGYVVVTRDGDITRENPGLLSAAHLAALRLNVTGLASDLSLLIKLRQCGANFSLRDEYGNTVRDLVRLVIPQFTPSCTIRHNAMGSHYAHRLEYDSWVNDVYSQADPFDHDSVITRHPTIYLPVSTPNQQYNKHRIEEILDGDDDDHAEVFKPPKGANTATQQFNDDSLPQPQSPSLPPP